MYPTNYNNYYPNPQAVRQPQQLMGLKGRPVASIEEARATAVDFDGSIFFFPDLANKRIYTKQINMDGTASLNMYELKEIPVEQVENKMGDYVTREEFNLALNKIQNLLSGEGKNKKEEVTSYEF